MHLISTFFVDKIAEINGAHYGDELLVQKLLRFLYLSARQCACTPSFWDCGTALKIHSWFQSAYNVDSNNPDLKLVDYKIRSVMQDMVCRTKIRDFDELRRRIQDAWDESMKRASFSYTSGLIGDIQLALMYTKSSLFDTGY